MLGRSQVFMSRLASSCCAVGLALIQTQLAVTEEHSVGASVRVSSLHASSSRFTNIRASLGEHEGAIKV